MQRKSGFLNSLYETLASIKLTIFVFLILAAASVVGTLLPQGLSEHELHSQFSPGMVKFIEALGLDNLYHSRWFQTLMLLLCVNLIVCSMERLPKILKIIRHQEDRVNPQKLLKFSLNKQIGTRIPWEEAQSRLTKIVSEDFATPLKIPSEGNYSAIAEKGRWSPLMVYVVHLSVLLILVGALIGSFFGFKGFMNIPEGETSGEVMVTGTDRSITLPFQVHVTEFDVSYYDTGAPKEFRSDLVILEDGKEVLKRSIRVNDPLTFKGVTFYQASYGSTLKEAVIQLTDRDSGKTYDMTLPFRANVTIPGTKDQVQVAEYQQDLAGFGPALGIVFSKGGEQQSTGSWVLARRPDFHGNRIQNYQVKVIRTQDSEYTGLQVKQDPGIWTVYIGFTIMLIGIGLTFYMSHRRVWIWAAPSDKGARIVMAGRTNKNSLAFEYEFNRLCDRLEAELKTDTGKRKSA